MLEFPPPHFFIETIKMQRSVLAVETVAESPKRFAPVLGTEQHFIAIAPMQSSEHVHEIVVAEVGSILIKIDTKYITAEKVPQIVHILSRHLRNRLVNDIAPYVLT